MMSVVFEILIIILLSALILGGFVFTLFPFLPGILFTLAAAVIFIAWKGLAALGIVKFSLIIFLTVLYFLMDWFAGIYGAKKFGASRYGVIGAILGGLFGMMAMGLPGIFIGPIIGTIALEFWFNKDLKQAIRTGYGAGWGMFMGTIGKLLIATIATVILIWGMWR